MFLFVSFVLSENILSADLSGLSSRVNVNQEMVMKEVMLWLGIG